jgi:nicotinate phosphoribosyltransferase
MNQKLKTLYKHNLTLLTDLYQLTMAYGYWKNRMHDHEAVFHLFFRKHPFNGNYSVACGLELVIEYLKDLKFEVDDIQYLGGLTGADGKPLFEEGFLNHLQRMEFRCDIEAVEEGTVIFPHEPLIRVRGPLIQAQLIETALLTIINFQTLIATKAARMRLAAKNDTILEFGLRRAQGIDGGISASRAAYIGGCDATSNVLAGKLFDIPVRGTHAHSWVMCHENELRAFEAYAHTMPNNCVFLVDTYDTIEGVKNAIKVGQKLRKQGYEMNGIRLDSGDLAALSIAAREMLDQAGFPNAKVVASDNLDEYQIEMLKARGAKISVWGIGTRLVTAYDQPALGGVYKLAALKAPQQDWEYKMKLSETVVKVSNPGVLNVWRYSDENGLPIADMIYDESKEDDNQVLMSFEDKAIDLSLCKREKLLHSIFKKGQLVYQPPNIHEKRAKSISEISLFNKKLKPYLTGLQIDLYHRKMNLLALLRKE